MLLDKAYKLLNFLVFLYDQFDPDRTYNDINILKISKISIWSSTVQKQKRKKKWNIVK